MNIVSSANSVSDEKKRSWNPLAADAIAQKYTCYTAVQGTELIHPLMPDIPIEAELINSHSQIRQKILGEGYPCVGARSAFNRQSYRFGLYPHLATDEAVYAVCHDLYEYSHDFQVVDGKFVTYLAMFRGPEIKSEQHFESLFWQQLQAMHDVDVRYFSWDKAVNSDPENDNFSFSIGGRAFFVVGLHPLASRLARKTQYPTLVFNLHEQFERLRVRGKFETMKQVIRARDIAFQGSINPMLENFGENSEARQYSGRAVPGDWQCPFHPNKKETP
ncbi:MAG: YqcI/YcgG family protein [Nitrosomonas sp.]|nr:MAG: YqcI/YcgG family protein [Nitrosomonas sp.]